jgi:adenosylcobinamide-phosphate synthase
MIVTAIILAFLLDQIRPVESGHAALMWLGRWIDAVAKRMDASGQRDAWLAWMAAVVAPALAVALIGWLCTRVAGWLGQLAWAVAVLYFTLGFRQFSHRYTAIRDALAAGDLVKAQALLAQWDQTQAGYSGMASGSGTGQGMTRDAIVRAVIVRAMLSAHRWVFGVLFWFCLLSPAGLGLAGAALYRCTEFAARHWQNKVDPQQPASPALLAAAQMVWRVIDWLPVRATALTLAIVGNFEDAIAAWRRRGTNDSGGSADQDNDAILLAAAAGALGIHLDKGLGDNAMAPHPAASAQPLSARNDAADPVYPPYPPDLEPATPPAESAFANATGASGLSGAELDTRHFVQVAGLLWRGVALWLLLLFLLTLAHVLG